MLGTIQDLFTGPGRAKAMSAYSVVAGISGLAGPLIAGLLVTVLPTGLGWRAVVALSAPLAAGTFVLGARHLPGRTRPAPPVGAEPPARAGTARTVAGRPAGAQTQAGRPQGHPVRIDVPGLALLAHPRDARAAAALRAGGPAPGGGRRSRGDGGRRARRVHLVGTARRRLTAAPVWRTSGFVLFENLPGAEPFVHIELLTRPINIDEPTQVDTYRRAFLRLQQASTTGDQTEEMITQIRRGGAHR